MMCSRRRSASTLRIPADPALPGLAALLDKNIFARAVAALLPPGATVDGCRPWYVRYKPQTNAIAVHELQVAGIAAPLLVHGKCYTDENFAAARDKAANSHWSDPTLGQPHVAVPEHRMLLFGFPNDQVLAGVRFAANPKRIQRVLYAHVPEFPADTWRISDSRLTIAPVRFKPEKRAVLRVDTRVRHRLNGTKHPLRVYLRINGKGEGAATATLMQRLHDGFASHPAVRTPRVLAYLAESQVTIVADVGGEALPLDLAGARLAGEALAALHAMPAAGVPVRTVTDIMSDVADTVRTVAALAPELADTAGDLLATLRQRATRDAEATPLLVHGDYHPGQLLLRDEYAVLLDFDRSHLGDPAADLGNYAAHVIYRSVTGDAGDPQPLVDAVQEAYAVVFGEAVHPRRMAFWTAVGLMQLAPAPFRILAPLWPKAMSAILAACCEELS